MTEHSLLLIGAIVLGLFLLSALIGLCIFGPVAVVVGAGVLLAGAASLGFIGIAAYFALWVFAFPLMLIASALVGIVVAVCQWREDHPSKPVAKYDRRGRPKFLDSDDRLDWNNRRGRWADDT